MIMFQQVFLNKDIYIYAMFQESWRVVDITKIDSGFQ